MWPFVFEAAPRPMDLTAFAGLTLVSETMRALGLDEVVRERLQLRERQRGYDEFDKLHALVLVQAAGGDCVEDVRILARDAGLVRRLARPLPSPDALHDFLGMLDEIGQDRDQVPGAAVPISQGPTPPARPSARSAGLQTADQATPTAHDA